MYVKNMLHVCNKYVTLLSYILVCVCVCVCVCYNVTICIVFLLYIYIYIVCVCVCVCACACACACSCVYTGAGATWCAQYSEPRTLLRVLLQRHPPPPPLFLHQATAWEYAQHPSTTSTHLLYPRPLERQSLNSTAVSPGSCATKPYCMG